MARQQKNKQGAQQVANKSNENVETLSHAPVEGMPEEAGTVTKATADAAPRDPVVKGDVAGLAEEQVKQARAKQAEAEAKLAQAQAKVQAQQATTPVQVKEAEQAQVVATEKVEATKSTVTWYRVLADKFITGNGGFRSKLRAGKEFSSSMYNPKKLRAQGVQLQEITVEERASF